MSEPSKKYEAWVEVVVPDYRYWTSVPHTEADTPEQARALAVIYATSVWPDKDQAGRRAVFMSRVRIDQQGE